jgi:hypothetical protein
MPAHRRSAQLGTLLATLLLAAGCGGTEPEPLKAMEPEVPADLCATVPPAAREGLVASASSDDTGNPTAACSLRTPDGAAQPLSAVVTWVQSSDEVSADDVLRSQCAAVDRRDFRAVSGFEAAGAEQACAASGKLGGADSATLAGVNGLEVVTVRLTSEVTGGPRAVSRGQQMLEGVLAALTGGS